MTDQELVAQLTPMVTKVMWAGFGAGIASMLFFMMFLYSVRGPFHFFVRWVRCRRAARRRERVLRRGGVV